eukprot:TRINITY_DN76750_c0_g1_i1.p1 TRINITY_DN76750_c0_g1~~TRINITY_DN76750_c0_g1_i1.p1  ORF type:complete len:115 (+),score=7.23 TRINITY_DN76750_c0_g1_i1:633-977(+)
MPGATPSIGYGSATNSVLVFAVLECDKLTKPGNYYVLNNVPNSGVMYCLPLLVVSWVQAAVQPKGGNALPTNVWPRLRHQAPKMECMQVCGPPTPSQIYTVCTAGVSIRNRAPQ